MKNAKNKNTNNNDIEMLTINLYDGTDIECEILSILNVGGQDYIYLLPQENCKFSGEGEFFIYKYFENEDEEITLDNNLTDDEFDMASDAFDALLDEQEYFEIIEDEDK